MANVHDPRPSHSAYRRFLAERAPDLQSISRRSRGEVSVGDLESEAWLIAVEIGKRRGYPIDFSRREDQNKVIAWLHNEALKYTESKIRNAAELESDKEETKGRSWDRAPRTSDPLHAWIEQEEESAHWDIGRLGYSQAAVYAALIVRFGRLWTASYLVITTNTLKQRVERAVQHVRRQPSLFDRTERIDPEFLPRPGQPRLARKQPATTVRQFRLRLNRLSRMRYVLSTLYRRLRAFLAGSIAASEG